MKFQNSYDRYVYLMHNHKNLSQEEVDKLFCGLKNQALIVRAGVLSKISEKAKLKMLTVLANGYKEKYFPYAVRNWNLSLDGLNYAYSITKYHENLVLSEIKLLQDFIDYLRSK